ncbi:aminoglycoside phosphotransferase family protein [Paenibacillus spongiae]|uniref:Aminoglycoside phosphotransferase family protein n=1 Tax=Paenibacillus spongiae TaxID=2909671 RepID=A0ABY5S162_9BACL|nr:aminoglycoside phosphotransferase family protein [Paenibacillus spongiae]UVI27594.1 aminoglycoside phosphotransferase family protein [Paenibacillus spongiae]
MNSQPNHEIESNTTETETILSAVKSVSKQGDVVLRPAGEWTPHIHGLLRHLSAEGFSAAPGIAGSGTDGFGRETLEYIPGEFVHPAPWSDEGLIEVGRLVRRLHDMSASYTPAGNAVWQPWFLRGVDRSERPKIISHGDIAPWNMVTKDGLPIGLIDWEFTGPVDPLTELARVCWLFPQLNDDDVAVRVGLPSPETRARQLRLLVDGYGLDLEQRSGFVDLIIEVAVREAAEEAVEADVKMESEGPLWGLAWRIRAASWMLRHRSLLEEALK